MFLDHYKLREQPFGVTPDPRFLMDTPSHREAWATLHYGLESGRGFLGLIAPPGMGKTTLLFRLMEELRGRTRTAFLFQTQCDSDEFLTLLLNDLEDIPRSPTGAKRQEQNFSPDWQSRCERAITATHADGAAILIQQGQSLVCTASIGAAPPVGSFADTDVGLSAECFRTRRTISCENAHVDQRLSLESRRSLPYTSFLIAPLSVSNRVVGVMEVFSLRKSAFGVTERTALYELGGERSADDAWNPPPYGPTTGHDRAALHEALHAILVRESEKGVPPVLIVDEAQNLNDSVLETIRLLSDFETPRAKLLQVVLAGQTELRDRLSSPGLVQLRQRISMMSELVPLNRREIGDYIAHRLRVAGYAGPPLFTPETCGFIAELSSGIPRNVNNICFQAMSLAYANGTTNIGADILGEVTTDFNWGKDNKLAPEPAVGQVSAQSGSSAEQGKEVFSVDPVIHLPVIHSPSHVMVDRRLLPQNETEMDSARKSSRFKGRRDDLTAALACGCIIILAGGVLIWHGANSPKRPPTQGAQVISSHADPPAQSGAMGTPVTSEKPVAYSPTATPTPPHAKHKNSPRKADERPSSPQLNGSPTPAANPVSFSTASSAGHPAQNMVNSSNSPPSLSRMSSSDRPLSPSEMSSSNTAPTRSAIPAASVEGQGGTEELLGSDPIHTQTEVVANESDRADTAAAETSAGVAPSSALEPSKVVDTALVKMVSPIYPPLAREAKIEGDVVLSALISREGKVRNVRVISGNSALINAAVNAVKQWRYPAFLVDGGPQDIRKQIVVKFSLNSKK